MSDSMREEILINITPKETRIAFLENGVLQELQIERANYRGIVGNIYKGKIGRVLPGMQAAFVDIGLERAAFLHVSDIVSVHDIHNEPLDDNLKGKKEDDIRKMICEGQDIVVQVIKEPLGTKGARVSAHLTLPSRYLVLLPEHDHIGISQRIEDDAERERLKQAITSFESINDKLEFGYIVRTAAEGISTEDIHQDMLFVQKLWKRVVEKIPVTKRGTIVHEDLSLALGTMRDLDINRVERIRIDSSETYRKILDFANEFIPNIVEHIELYEGDRPIFELYSVDDEIQKALQRKVQLKSGGYLIIDQTEAMTTIDVNTGGFVGHRNLEETIFKTNLEASLALARQLRLRNLGGIVIVDFIDMLEEEHKRQVLRTLEKALAKDHAKTHISEVSNLGLVQMTRKRTRESLEHILCEACNTCNGRGFIKSVDTVCYEIFREVTRSARAYEPRKFMVVANDLVVERLTEEESASIAELEDFVGCPIQFQVEPMYTQEQFDVVIM
jgi:ribonuclease G